MEDFSTWLAQEMEEREWTSAVLARKSGLSPGSISNIIRRARRPGPGFAARVAIAFNLPPDEVFVKAGLLPPGDELDSVARRILYLLGGLSDDDKETVLTITEAIYEKRRRPR